MRTSRRWKLAAGILQAALLTAGLLRAEGVTVVMHGWNVAAGEPAWTEAMQTAISDGYLGGEQHFGTITVTGSVGNLTATCSPWDVNLATSTTGEVVIRVDWSAVANHLVTRVTAQEVAAAIAPKLYQGQNGELPLAELPIHLVGHSRGGGLVCEIARLLGLQGIEVDQLTPLDAHPLTSSDPQPVIPPDVVDTPVAVYENVLFADGYWQDIDYPQGQYVNGAYNRKWSPPDDLLEGGYHNHPDAAYRDFADHLNILLVYHGTIDLATPTSNGEATLDTVERTSWYNTYETNGGTPGQRAGFYYSLIAGQADRLSTDTPAAGGDAIVDGVHDDPVLGGSGARSALTWSSAVWPNLVTLEVLSGGVPLGPGSHDISPGDPLEARYGMRDYDSPSQVDLRLDADRNPYNVNDVAVIVCVGHTATGASLVEHTVPWDTSGLAPGTSGVVCGTIYDTARTRYLCAQGSLNVVGEPQADLAISKTDGQASAIPGLGVTYTISVSNAGPSAVAGATVGDTFPAVLTGVSWTCAGSGGGSCTAGGSGDVSDSVDLPVGASVTYTARGTVEPGATGSLVNTATVAPPAGVTDPTGGNNSATDTDTLVVVLFADGFATGDTSRWSAAVP